MVACCCFLEARSLSRRTCCLTGRSDRRHHRRGFDQRDHAHLRAAFRAEERIDLVDLADELGPGGLRSLTRRIGDFRVGLVPVGDVLAQQPQSIGAWHDLEVALEGRVQPAAVEHRAARRIVGRPLQRERRAQHVGGEGRKDHLPADKQAEHLAAQPRGEKRFRDGGQRSATKRPRPSALPLIRWCRYEISIGLAVLTTRRREFRLRSCSGSASAAGRPSQCRLLSRCRRSSRAWGT